MKNGRIINILAFLTIFLSAGCKNDFKQTIPTGRLPFIEPDYKNVTIPFNIAPMNFIIREDGSYFKIEVTSESGKNNIEMSSRNGLIRFPEKAWRKLIHGNKGNKIKIQIYSANKDKIFKKYEAFYIFVAMEPIDPYLVYRLIHPGYYSWSEIKIVQRCLENFTEEPVIDNAIMDKNCINCHSFNNNDPGRFLVHIRGSKSGTYFVENDKITRTDPKTDDMPGSATYPSWHPGGKFVAFSSNQVRQSFYSGKEKSIEVFDLVSSLILYDRTKNKITNINEDDNIKYLRTFPSWSPDGKYLYYCRAVKTILSSNPGMDDIMSIHHNLVRKSFNSDSSLFGKTEVVLNASEMNKSISFPRISPDGKNLVFTFHDYGTFPIWHKEADLYLLNTSTMEYKKMSINSNESESYHSWSSNGKWLVFSSKRSDGRSTRPYFAYMDSWEHTGKPFILPQKDPGIYDSMFESFNIPELITGRIKMKPRDFEKAALQDPLKTDQGKIDKKVKDSVRKVLNSDSIRLFINDQD